MRSRCTTGGGAGPVGCRLTPSDGREGQQCAAGRPDLDLGAEGRAHAAVITRCPPAVVDLDLADRVLPVLPQPVLVEAGVEVVPRQHFGLLALTGRVPVERQRCAGEDLRARALPPLEREVLAPAVEPATVRPDATDHGTDPAVAAREQSFDDRRPPVVVADADRLA